MSVENENNKTIVAETSIIKLIIVREFDKYHLCYIKSIKLSMGLDKNLSKPVVRFRATSFGHNEPNLKDCLYPSFGTFESDDNVLYAHLAV